MMDVIPNRAVKKSECYLGFWAPQPDRAVGQVVASILIHLNHAVYRLRPSEKLRLRRLWGEMLDDLRIRASGRRNRGSTLNKKRQGLPFKVNIIFHEGSNSGSNVKQMFIARKQKRGMLESETENIGGGRRGNREKSKSYTGLHEHHVRPMHRSH
jgi:hypothetical protein